MDDMHALMTPVFAFVVNILVQITSYRLFNHKIGLLGSLFIGLLSGWFAIFIYIFSQMGLLWVELLQAEICFTATWYCFFHFVNIGEASLRIRVLDEIKKSRRGLTEEEILNYYNPQIIIDTRLQRLVKNQEIICTDGYYRLGKSRLILAAKIIHFVRILIHGPERALDYITVYGKNRVVIFGSSGFIGGHLQMQLKKNRRNVLALTRNDLDLTDSQAVKKLQEILKPKDVVVFLSCITPDKGNDSQSLAMNVKMAANLSDALQAVPVSHFILLSSDAVYPSETSPFTSLTPIRGTDSYSLSHIERENIIQKVCEKLKIPLAIFRPSALYGEGDTHNSYGPNRFIKSALTEFRIQLFGNGEELRDHLYIDDFVNLLIEAINLRIEGVFNVGTGNGISFRQIAELIQTQMSRDIKIESLERKQPIVNRIHDISETIKSFKNIHFRSINEIVPIWIRNSKWSNQK